MHIDDLKQSRFLTQNEVDPPVLVTIKGCKQENVAKEGADPEYRWTLFFHELEKPMTLNSTNGQIIAAITGSKTSDAWIGRKIILYRDPNVSFGGRLVGGIRCRAPQSQPVADIEPKTTQEQQVNHAESDKLAEGIARGQTNPDYVGDNPDPPPEDGPPF